MKVQSVHIRHYKSFRDSNEVNLDPVFNIIVGENNAGKTAFVEALSLKYSPKVHRTLQTAPTPTASDIGSSEVKLTVQFEGGELSEMLRSMGTVFVPVSVGNLQEALPYAQQLLKKVIEGCSVQYSTVNRNFISGTLIIDGQPIQPIRSAQFRFDPDLGQFRSISDSLSGPEYGSLFFAQLRDSVLQRLYLFNAERLNISESQLDKQTELNSNASNLAQVLDLLQRNVARFKRFNEYVSLIFPQIKWVSLDYVPQNRTRILVWSIDPSTERTDLAIPLSESGTGVGQILAILYVVVNSDFPRAIIIDEPQSFLHPGAVRKLFEILMQHPRHQYIITTHSPVALSTLLPQRILAIRKPEAESIVESIDITEVQKMRLFLLDIGVKLSDVFGADGILWVEGATEEACFTLILPDEIRLSLPGTVIVGVVQTSDFASKYSKTIFEIYARLSGNQVLLPLAVGFIFDREGRTEQQMQDLRRQSKGDVYFLQRRMYENYLLIPHAISSALQSVEHIEFASDDINQWILEHRWDKKYFDKAAPDELQTDSFWFENVHGAKMLSDIFRQAGTEYKKVLHGVALTKWLIENDPDKLAEVRNLISQVFTKTTP